MASYKSSIHLSRALSPLASILTPSVLTVRTTFDWGWTGVEVEGAGGGAVGTDCLRGGGSIGDGAAEACGDGLEVVTGAGACCFTLQQIS
jgi:hypothetical protein